MMIEEIDKFIREHERDIVKLATDGDRLARVIIVLHDMIFDDPRNITAVNVLAMAVREYKIGFSA